MGYYSDNARLSVAGDDLLSFRDNPDQLNLDQAWVYFEKEAESNGCSWDWGFRVDAMYGVDAQKTQAFGNPRANVRNQGTWDASFDNGIYGWAIPQAYLEFAKGDWSIIAGRFFTLVGYEVVPAPDNFFYSHALTMFNSEPFTHTGVLATYSGIDNVELYGGWTLGWDTGFDQNFGGSSWLGGFSTDLTDNVTFTYISTAGNLGFRSAGQNGYSHSLVFDFTLTDRLNYVLQSDYAQSDGFLGTVGAAAEDGINQYLFYTINDCWKIGGRMEWWKTNTITGSSTSFYEMTAGVNYKPHANVTVRPEVRYDWTPAEGAVNPITGTPYNSTAVGLDVILTF